MIKTEFWSSNTLARVSRDARLMFIAMWNFADDFGALKANVKWIMGNLFEADDSVTPALIKQWAQELSAQKLIVPYTVENRDYYQIRSWKEHQRVDKPSSKRLPSIPSEVLSRAITFKNESEQQKKDVQNGEEIEEIDVFFKQFNEMLTTIKRYPVEKGADLVLLKQIKKVQADEQKILEYLESWRLRVYGENPIQKPRERLYGWIKRNSADEIKEQKIKKAQVEKNKKKELAREAQKQEVEKQQKLLGAVKDSATAIEYLIYMGMTSEVSLKASSTAKNYMKQYDFTISDVLERYPTKDV